MKNNVKLLSILTIVLTIAAAVISISTPFGKANFLTKSTIEPLQKDSINQMHTESLNRILKDMSELSIQSSSDTISYKEYSLRLKRLQNKVEDLKEIKNKSTGRTSEIVYKEEKAEGFTTQTFWIKVIFSSIFCLAALYVVLSQKYDDETKKWAFSVLTLIAGVWIGTIS